MTTKTRNFTGGLLIVGLTFGCTAAVADLDDAGMPDGSVDSGYVDSGYQDAGPTDAGCEYPIGNAGFLPGHVFPDFPLGVGFLNFDGGADALQDAGPIAATDTLLQLHCSGMRYAILDLSTAWCPQSRSLASSLPGYVPGWLDAGGIVMTVLEQGPGTSVDAGFGSAATASDLSSWASLYGTNYSLVNDPTERLTLAVPVLAWPTLFIVDLSTMEVVEAVDGYNVSFPAEFTAVLSAIPDAG